MWCKSELMANRCPEYELTGCRGNSVGTRDIGYIEHRASLVSPRMLIRSLHVNVGALREVVISHQADRLIVRMKRTACRVETGSRVVVHSTDVKGRSELIFGIHLEVVEP